MGALGRLPPTSKTPRCWHIDQWCQHGAQLTIRSDEAYQLAHEISTRRNIPVTDIVLQALRRQAADLSQAPTLSPDQHAIYEAIKAAGKRAAATKFPGATSNHDNLYDDEGLPK